MQAAAYTLLRHEPLDSMWVISSRHKLAHKEGLAREDQTEVEARRLPLRFVAGSCIRLCMRAVRVPALADLVAHSQALLALLGGGGRRVCVGGDQDNCRSLYLMLTSPAGGSRSAGPVGLPFLASVGARGGPRPRAVRGVASTSSWLASDKSVACHRGREANASSFVGTWMENTRGRAARVRDGGAEGESGTVVVAGQGRS